jgi:hypothetical protein
LNSFSNVAENVNSNRLWMLGGNIADGDSAELELFKREEKTQFASRVSSIFSKINVFDMCFVFLMKRKRKNNIFARRALFNGERNRSSRSYVGQGCQMNYLKKNCALQSIFTIYKTEIMRLRVYVFVC